MTDRIQAAIAKVRDETTCWAELHYHANILADRINELETPWMVSRQVEAFATEHNDRIIAGVNDQKQWNAIVQEMQDDVEFEPIKELLEQLKEPEHAQDRRRMADTGLQPEQRNTG